MPLITIRDTNGTVLATVSAESNAQALEILALRGMSLPRADLRGVNLTGAKLQGLQAPAADVSTATLDRARCERASFAGAKFTATSVAQMQIQGANLDRARFDSVDHRTIVGLSPDHFAAMNIVNFRALPTTDPRSVDVGH